MCQTPRRIKLMYIYSGIRRRRFLASMAALEASPTCTRAELWHLTLSDNSQACAKPDVNVIFVVDFFLPFFAALRISAESAFNAASFSWFLRRRALLPGGSHSNYNRHFHKKALWFGIPRPNVYIYIRTRLPLKINYVVCVFKPEVSLPSRSLLLLLDLLFLDWAGLGAETLTFSTSLMTPDRNVL